MEKIAHKTFYDRDGDYMFTKVDGSYVFQRIPLELRGEFFYWYKLKFPDKWAKFMDKLKKEGKTLKLKDAKGNDVSPNVKPSDPKVEPVQLR